MQDTEFYLDGDIDLEIEADQARVDAAKAGDAVAVRHPEKMVTRHATNTVPFFWDLETIPDQDRIDEFDLPPVPPVPECDPIEKLPAIDKLLASPIDSIKASLASHCAPPEYLDQVVLAEKNNVKGARKGVFDLIDKARLVREEAIQAHADRIKLLSTTPEYCSIAAIGVALGNDAIQSFVVGEQVPGGKPGDLITEEMILSAFWDNVIKCSPVVGYNIISFDLPVVLVRSAILGVPASKRFNLSPWSDEVCDLYVRRFGPRGNTGKDRPGKLKELANLYGLDIPAGDCSGADVYDLMQTAEGRVKVGSYVESDIYVLREMHRLLSGYFWA